MPYKIRHIHFLFIIVNKTLFHIVYRNFPSIHNLFQQKNINFAENDHFLQNMTKKHGQAVYSVYTLECVHGKSYIILYYNMTYVAIMFIYLITSCPPCRQAFTSAYSWKKHQLRPRPYRNHHPAPQSFSAVPLQSVPLPFSLHFHHTHHF